MPDSLRNTYIPNLSDWQACCSRNYLRLQRLLAGLGEASELAIEDEQQGSFTLTCVEETRYTTTVRMKHERGHSLLSPVMLVRLYHDAKMAEVLSSQQISHIKPRYHYPNRHMHQQDEKHQVNHFLGEWLEFCLANGRQTSQVI